MTALRYTGTDSTLVQGDSSGLSRRLGIVVVGEGSYAAHPLPNAGSVSIGRDPACDVALEDPAVSRKHAILRVGERLEVQDLGSSNGTRVRGQRIDSGASVEIAVGDVVEVGGTMLIVQILRPSQPPTRLWSHGYFEGRIEEECARAGRNGGSFGLLRLQLAGGTPVGVVEQAFADLMRAGDVAASYGPRQYELLMPDLGADDAESVKLRLLERLRDRGVTSDAGLASYPRDGRSAEALMDRAGARLRGDPIVEGQPNPIVVQDPRMLDLHRLVDRVAAGHINVLLLGETGVGKEVLAWKLHRSSARADKPFLRLNSAALPESLLESELFGHERGAFSGATETKRGLLEVASGGSVLLDEVVELPLGVQAKLLRVIEESEVRRLGGQRAIPIDVRYFVATNRDLDAEVAARRFREDLYYRLCGFALVVPPLRERLAEIEPLARTFVSESARRLDRPRGPSLSPDALEVIRGYNWPGNVRELRNVMERAVLLAGDGPILPEHLPLEKMRATWTRPAGTAALGPAAPTAPAPATPEASSRAPGAEGKLPELLRARMAEIERTEIENALDRCGGNQTRAAKQLGISRRKLVARLASYGLIRRPKGSS